MHIADIEKYATQGSEGRSRKRRSYALHERRVRSADVGVRVGYEVISAVDLAFTPNASSEGITIFQVNFSLTFRNILPITSMDEPIILICKEMFFFQKCFWV